MITAQNKRHQQQSRAVFDSHGLPPPISLLTPSSSDPSTINSGEPDASPAPSHAYCQDRLPSSHNTHIHTHTQNTYTSFLLTALHGIRAIPLAVTAVSAVLLHQYFTNTATADRLLCCHHVQQRHSRLRLLPGTHWIQPTPLCVQLN